MSDRFGSKKVTRRDFLGIAGFVTAGVALFGSIIGSMRLPLPAVIPEASGKLRVGKFEDFTPGTITNIPKHKVRIETNESGISAMSMVCTHLGCIVREVHDGFECPCHGSVFNKQGKVTRGPAPRPLRWLEISQAVDGSLVVNTKREVPIGTFYHA